MKQTAVTPSELGIPDAIPQPKRKDWRIGMVGFGSIARAHVAAYASAGWPIVAVADPDPAAQERARQLPGVQRVYDDYLISIADFGDGLTGHILHGELLRSSLTAGRCRIDGDEGSIVFGLGGQNLLLESKQLGAGAYALGIAQMHLAPSQCGTMGDLLLAIEESREPLVSARRNLATMRHIVAEEQSAQSGCTWVALGSV